MRPMPMAKRGSNQNDRGVRSVTALLFVRGIGHLLRHPGSHPG